MMMQQKNTTITVLITLLCLAAFNLQGCKKKAEPSAEGSDPKPVSPAKQPIKTAANNETKPDPKPELVKPVKTVTTLPLPANPSSKQLDNVVSAAESWRSKEVSFANVVPDFSMTDLNGTVHKLSDYRGKNVLVSFWAPWSPHSRVELPTLSEIRKKYPAEQLAIMAVSIISPQNTEATIRQHAKGFSDINYPVFAAHKSALPNPLNQIEYLPSTAFISPDGRIKLITEGQLSDADIKNILEAQ